MAFATHPAFSEILQVPGYLFYNPTSLPGDESTWGTKFGFCENGVIWEPGGKFFEVREEETGEEVVNQLWLGGNASLTAILQNWNATVIFQMFPGLSSTKNINFPGTIKAGKEIPAVTNYAKPVIFVPQDPTNDPVLLFQKAIIDARASMKLRLSHKDKTLFPVVLTALTKTAAQADGQFYFGPISGAVLR